jgi:hypothetical protein
MQEPISDQTFGRLEWDPLLGCWLGGIDWPPGLHTELAVWTSGGDPTASLRRARESLLWLQGHEEQTRRFVAEATVAVYNDAWQGNDGPLTTDDFAGSLELVRVGFEPDGSLLISYGAGALFGGHILDARFDSTRSLRKTTLVG